MKTYCIDGITVERIDSEPFSLNSHGFICYPFKVVGPENIKRTDLNRLSGKELDGKTICGVESFAIENQFNETISIAFKVGA